MATELVAAACRQGIQARFFTTSALVMILRRAKEEDRLDKELASLAKNQLNVIAICRGRDYADTLHGTSDSTVAHMRNGMETAGVHRHGPVVGLMLLSKEQGVRNGGQDHGGYAAETGTDGAQYLGVRITTVVVGLHAWDDPGHVEGG